MRASIRTVAACGVLLACGGCDALPPPIARPDVLLFSLDTTRADRIGAYGHAAASTPTFDALARDGVLFESAYSPTPITLPAHASMLTGLYPSAHGVRDNGLFALGPDATLVSEVFAAHGWRTGAFVGSFAVDERTGLAQGFEIYSDKGSETRGIVPERTADAVAKDAIAWLETLAPEDNFFLWLHFYDPHLPFAAPEPWRSRNADPYDAEIAFADAQLARVLRSIETRGSDAPLLVVATSDHGEGLGDHGEGSHGVLLYQGTVRVPLVISGPHVARSAGTRVVHAVSIADIAPTLVTLAGLPADALPEAVTPSLIGADGRVAATDPERAIYLETYFPYYAMRWHALRGVVQGGEKLVRGPSRELYALGDDPAEAHDLAATRSARVEQLDAALDGLLARHAPLAWAMGRNLDPSEQRMLATMGYVVTDSGSDPFDADLPDPRARIGAFDRISEAVGQYTSWARVAGSPPPRTAFERDRREREQRERLEKARQLLIAVETQNPGAVTPLKLGVIEGALGNHARAIELLERDLVQRPGASVLELALANSYAGLGRHAEAAAAAQRAIEAANPPSASSYQWLAQHYEQRGDPARAASWLEQLLEFLPPTDSRRAATQAWLARMRAAAAVRAPHAVEGIDP